MSVSRPRRIAIVVQRYGVEVNGGAELLARWVAEQLAAAGDEVHVLTTCAQDYVTWADVYPPGESELNGVCIHRFRVDSPRDWPRHQQQTARIFQYPRTLFDELTWVRDQGPYSSELLHEIARRYRTTDAFIFFTFHYATTFFGLPLVSDKALLVPTAHDDAFLTMPIFRQLFHLPQGIIYLTEPEQAAVERTSHNSHVPHRVAGMHVSVPDDVSADRFRARYGIDGEFLLYVGRIHESKNVPELLDYYERFVSEYAGRDEPPPRLVLLGKSHIDLPQRPDIVPLGFVPDEDKFDALAAAAVLLQPSANESLSIITLEAWAMGTPVLTTGNSAVVKQLARASNGGLYYHTYDEFSIALERLLGSASMRARLGSQGRRFVEANFQADAVIAQYNVLLESLNDRPQRD